MNHAAVLLRLLAAHFIADFYLQKRAWVEERTRNKWGSHWLYFHSALYALVVTAGALAWGEAFWLWPFLFVTHAVIDGVKASRAEKDSGFLLDQFVHLGVVAVAWISLAPERLTLLRGLFHDGLNSTAILLTLIAFLINLAPAGRLIGHLTRQLRERLENQKARGLETAGFWIGCLERFFVLSFILVGYPQGIVILAGAKSVFRFGEIKDPARRDEAEYILIGTLLSYAIAFGTGILVKNFLK